MLAGTVGDPAYGAGVWGECEHRTCALPICPSIHEIVRDGDAIEVSCSPARSVILHMEQEYGVSVSIGRGGRRNGRILQTSPEGLITRVRIEPNHPESLYRRISVVDSQGHRAWSNPL